jgi:hypothetical protein
MDGRPWIPLADPKAQLGPLTGIWSCIPGRRHDGRRACRCPRRTAHTGAARARAGQQRPVHGTGPPWTAARADRQGRGARRAAGPVPRTAPGTRQKRNMSKGIAVRHEDSGRRAPAHLRVPPRAGRATRGLVSHLRGLPSSYCCWRAAAGRAVPGAARAGPGARQEGKSQDEAEDRRAERGSHPRLAPVPIGSSVCALPVYARVRFRCLAR